MTAVRPPNTHLTRRSPCAGLSLSVALEIPRRARGLAAILYLLAVAGCGYSFEPLSPRGVRSIQVPLFKNESRRRHIEFALTEAVTKELRRAGYRVAAPGAGDAVLFGRIVGVSETMQSEDPAGDLAQGHIAMTVEYRLVRRGREDAVASGRATEGGEVVFARGEDRPAGLDRAMLELARAVVRGLEPPPP